MPNFRYQATDAGGKRVTGEIEATTRDEVEGLLRADQLLVESVTQADPRPSAVSSGDTVELVEQLASLMKAGLPLASGLRAAGGEMISPSLRSTFLEIADRLDSGTPLDEALASSGRRFPARLRGLILSGTKSGRLADLLGEYVRAANLGSELRRLFWSTLAYPTLGLVAVLGLVGFICSMSVKAIDTLIGNFSDFGQQGPRNVEALAAMARLITDHGPTILLGILAVPFLIWGTIRFTADAASRRRLYCSVPVVGPILRFTSLTEFCHLLAMFIEADLPLPIAFEMAGSSVRDADVAEACGKMRRAVEQGDSLSAAMRLWPSVPAGLGQLFRWSEDRRNLPEALHLAGDMFESRARSQSSFASSVLATILLLLILWWVGFAIATLYLPMLSLINQLSG